MSKNTKNKNKSTKRSNNKRSLKGKWGHVGAPPKKTNWPNRPFTMGALFARNAHQCELSLRNKVEAGVKDGTILALVSKKQPGGAVGRPKSVFVLKANFDNKTMVLADKKHKTRAAKATNVQVAVTQAVPATAPVAAPAVADVPAAPATPDAPPAPVTETVVTETVAAAPAPEVAPAAPAPQPVVQ